MKLKTYMLSGCCILFLGYEYIHYHHQQYLTTEKALQAHVKFLCSDSLEGRLTGTRGEKLATQYVANLFHQLDFEPAGDHGTFFQEFDFTAGVSLGKNNSLSLTNKEKTIKHLILDKEWRPLSFSKNRSFETTELVFAGYGITAPAIGSLLPYDSYHGLNVKNKWVVVFRYIPEKISNKRNRQLHQYSSLHYKAFTAKEHGAKGIIFVSGPNSKVQHELIPLSFDTSLLGSDIVAISVNDDILDGMLKNHNSPFNSLKELQDKLDLGQLDVTAELTGIKLSGQIDVQQIKQRGRNVLARLRVDNTTEKLIIAGAHVDHLGQGQVGSSRSQENEKKLIHYGADDNASGVANVLEAAVTLSDLKRHGRLHGNKNILFAVWSGEELGLLGSTHFIKEFMAKSANKSLRPTIETNINLDMVGRLRENLVLQGVGSSSSWPKLVEQANMRHAIPIITQEDPYLPTDSTAFYLHGVPTLNLFTGSHDEYHSSRDKPETLNYEGMKRIAEFLVDLILAVEDESSLTDYRKVAKTGAHIGHGFRAYLGTIPDYTNVDLPGVKLSGTAKDSPAELAGLIQGDVIIQLAGKKINNIYDYTFVLSTLPIGKSVHLVVLRGKTLMTLMITARSRE